MTSKLYHAQRLAPLAHLLFAAAILGVSIFVRPGSANAQTFAGVMGERTRIVVGFQVKPGALQTLLPAPWRLNPLASGPLKGANFFVVLIDAVRDVDSEGKPRYSGGNPFVVFAAPGKHPETGQAASVVLSGFASNPANVPGYYQVYQPARVRVEHIAKSEGVDSEAITDIWEVRDMAGKQMMEFRLSSARKLGSRTPAQGELQVISAKDPGLWRTYKFETVTDVVRSVPDGIDQASTFKFRLSVPEYSELIDGSEKLVGITVAPWYVRQIFVR